MTLADAGRSSTGPAPRAGREPRGGPVARTGKMGILDAAVDNFQRVGYHAASMRDIARGAQLTVASIYHHFPSKQDILVEIMVRVLSDVIALTRGALLQAEGGAPAQLAAVVRAWVIFHTERRPEALIGASEIRSLAGSERKLVVALRDEQERVFREIVDRGLSEGQFTTPYPREAARAIINMGTTVATWYRPEGELTPEELADVYVHFALTVVGASQSLSAQR